MSRADAIARSEVGRFYEERGFAGRVGFGTSPALIVIDMARAWLDPVSPIAANFDAQVERIAALLATARATSTPVLFTTMPYPVPPADAVGVWAKKLPHCLELDDPSWMEIDARLAPRAGEQVIVKARPSAFYGTTLLSHLVSLGVDTLCITGCSTSGCIRATAESAFCAGLHAIVCEDCVGDRSASAHAANLVDIDNRYGDVVGSDEVARWLESVVARRSREPVGA